MIIRTPKIILYAFKFVNRNEIDTYGKTPLSKSGRRKETYEKVIMQIKIAPGND